MKTPALVVLLAAGSVAHATTFVFEAYEISGGAGTTLNNTVTVSASAGVLSFTLANNSSNGRMTAFYLELGSGLDGVTGFTSMTGLNGATIGFTPGSASPPAPNNISPSWDGSFFDMDVNSPDQEPNSLNAGESMRLDFAYNGSFVLTNLIDAIVAGDIRMVQRFQSIGTDEEGSAWLVTTAIVPLPPAAWAGLATLAAIGGLRMARRR